MELTPSPRRKFGLLNTLFFKLHRLKPSDAFLIKTALLALAIFLALFLIQLSTAKSVTIPSEGGTFSEGIVGTPRFVNPVLAVTRADRDLTSLIYDGLMTLGPDGVIVPNIAESITVSDDGLTYNVILKNNVSFHDGERLTAADVVFTVGRIQDPGLASVLRANFDGITVEEVGEYEINFILPEPYAPFIENLTFGILPQHIWSDAGTEEFPFSQYNSEPIGSGPYKVEKITRNASGIPETYVLRAFDDYRTPPKIETIELYFFPTEDRLIGAFNEGLVESVVGISPMRIHEMNINPETHHIEEIPLPRTFALFFNQNKSTALRDLSARRALDSSIDREALIQSVLNGYGNALHAPIPTGFSGSETFVSESPVADLDAAREILRNGGWELNPETQIWEKTIDGTLTPLTFSIATVNNSVFEATAEFLRTSWEQLGAEVSIKQFEQSDLTQAVIRPRDYEALLFGTQVGRSLDYYSFWHSSQRNDPGLNIALYANIKTDEILSGMRQDATTEGRAQALSQFSEEIQNEVPAIFLYTPELLYVFPNSINGATFKGVGEPHERFAQVYDWHINTESVWQFFTQ